MAFTILLGLESMRAYVYAFSIVVMGVMFGCQVSAPIKNRSGSTIKAMHDADRDFDNGLRALYISLNTESKQFKDIDSIFKQYNVKAKQYVPQSDTEKAYMHGYNSAMRERLRTLHGCDVYADAWNAVDDTQYFSKRTQP